MPAVQQYLQLARQQNIAVDDILQTLDIPAVLLSNNTETISGEQFQQLILALVNRTTDDLFGLHTAAFVQPSSYSVLGFIAMNCQTLGEAMTKIQPFEKLVGDMGITTLAQQGDYFSISWACAFTDTHVRRHMIDNCLASWLTFARYLTGDVSAPTQVLLSRKQPCLAQCAQYQALFKCSVVFSQAEDAIIFDKQLLTLPLNKGNEALLTTLESHANLQMRQLNESEKIIDKTLSSISQNLVKGEVSQQGIARCLNLSSKTLQRRLRDENTTFKSLVDKIRLETAQQLLLESSLTLNKISEQLGFSEPRSFFRWFQKKQKTTPGKYRRLRN
jgi:AraC-like DNA-binding protein